MQEALEWKIHQTGCHISEMSTYLVNKGINMKLRAASQKNMSTMESDFINNLIKDLINSRKKGLNMDETGNRWIERNFTTASSTLLEVEIMPNEQQRSKLIVELKLAHQRFLNSSMAKDMKQNCNPKLSNEDFITEMVKLNIPVSVRVYEGR